VSLTPLVVTAPAPSALEPSLGEKPPIPDSRPLGQDAEDIDESPLSWLHPRSWQANNRTRKFITLAERGYSREGDLEVLGRSVRAMLRQQDGRGSFYSDEDYLSGDRVDDQLGGSAMLAYYLHRVELDPKIRQALENSVRFHLDQLVFRADDRPFRYSRFYNARDSSGDWCNTLWCLSKANIVLRYGERFLSPETAARLRGLMNEYWSYISTYPARDENPCHNQLLAYCEIGLAYAEIVGKGFLRAELLDYYQNHLRRLRVNDRGYQVFTEFNKWDSHYSVLSWSILEALYESTGEPIFAEDADQMALYFNEQVSAGGYCWGGSRNNECGVDEFPQLFTARADELNLHRLLFPEPSHLWHRLVVDGHGGSGLVSRIERPAPLAHSPRPDVARPWHFQNKTVSVCLDHERKLHHLSAAGLEIIPAAGRATPGIGISWCQQGKWKHDLLQEHAPKSSPGLRYSNSVAIRSGDVTGLGTMQRGYVWETRQWWLSSGEALVWVTQLITHSFLSCEAIQFHLGCPVLTRAGGETVPVSELENAEGARVDSQGVAGTLLSREYLRCGDAFVTCTVPLQFVRPSDDSFHTFPTRQGNLWREAESSNQLQALVVEAPGKLECRQSLFFATVIDREARTLQVRRGAPGWTVDTPCGSFSARPHANKWHYSLQKEAQQMELPDLAFGYRAES
jgi:hypothetical protein